MEEQISFPPLLIAEQANLPLYSLVQDGFDRFEPVFLLTLTKVYRSFLQPIKLVETTTNGNVCNKMESVLIFLCKFFVKLKHLLPERGEGEGRGGRGEGGEGG